MATTAAPETTKLLSPYNLPKWLEQNSHLLKPPVNNYTFHHDPMTVMVVGGPNARSEYHINQTPEFFYQYRGRMLLKTIQNNKFVDVYINEGDIFLLPANTPHNPVRFADTAGVVIEQPRPEGTLDVLRWYCQNCEEKVYEASFQVVDLGGQIKQAVQAFEQDLESRKCKNCGTTCDIRPSEEAMEKMRTAPS